MTEKSQNSETAKGLALIIGALVVIVLVVKFWQQFLIVGAVALIALIVYLVARKTWRSRQARLAAAVAEDEQMARRAQEQHEQYLRGEDSGVYGRFTPADPDKPKGRLRRLPASPREWRDENRS
ncbi:type II secretory pathway pseudopilin PulG [Rhodococcus sp. OAS809]|uniref:hypothetical protein n=1 Tax=Rhodococcus sp. OAS809 TaxID=2663874 RepID=UPI00178A0664